MDMGARKDHAFYATDSWTYTSGDLPVIPDVTNINHVVKKL
jgi:hypothetical protein